MHLRAVGSRRLGITTRCKACCSTKLAGAELPAQLLGARLAAALNLQVLNFVTDNEIH